MCRCPPRLGKMNNERFTVSRELPSGDAFNRDGANQSARCVKAEKQRHTLEAGCLKKLIAEGQGRNMEWFFGLP